MSAVAAFVLGLYAGVIVGFALAAVLGMSERGRSSPDPDRSHE
jgi:ABC-type nitrate/sulfonate/bicarbonate transport system permease component